MLTGDGVEREGERERERGGEREREEGKERDFWKGRRTGIQGAQLREGRVKDRVSLTLSVKLGALGEGKHSGFFSGKSNMSSGV